jgi:uncharacterized protein YybS (DUF2232 family)
MSSSASLGSSIQRLAYYGPTFCFLTSFLFVFVPLVFQEPQGRRAVGVTLDNGSSLFRMLFPTGIVGFLVLFGLAALVFVIYRELNKHKIVADFFHNFYPGGTSPSQHLVKERLP